MRITDKIRKCDGLDEWEIKAWIPRLGSFPMERVGHEDKSDGYDIDQIHVLRLENGQFGIVTESGCSCYTSEDADIELVPTYEKAMEALEKWKKKLS